MIIVDTYGAVTILVSHVILCVRIYISDTCASYSILYIFLFILLQTERYHNSNVWGKTIPYRNLPCNFICDSVDDSEPAAKLRIPAYFSHEFARKNEAKHMSEMIEYTGVNEQDRNVMPPNYNVLFQLWGISLFQRKLL